MKVSIKFTKLLITSFILLATFQAKAESEGNRETRVAWVDTCPNEPDPPPENGRKSAIVGGLITAIAPKLIEGTVDYAAEALKASGQPNTVTSTARTSGYFYKLSKNGDLVTTVTCLLIVKGIFKPGVMSPDHLSKTGLIPEMEGLQNASFQFEAKMRPLRGAKYFQLVPLYLKVNEFEEFSIFDSRDRDFLITTSMTLPGASQPFGSFDFLFKDIARGMEVSDAKLSAAASLPIGFPTESADATSAKSKMDALLMPWLLALDIQSPPDPVPLRAPSMMDGTSLGGITDALCEVTQSYNRKVPKQFAVQEEGCKYVFEEPRLALEIAAAAAHRSPARTYWASQLCTFMAKDAQTNPEGPNCANMATNIEIVKLRAAVASKTFTYVTTQTTLQETRDGSKLALFLGTALAGSKTEVTSLFKEKLVPKTKADQDTSDDATRQIVNAVELTKQDVIQAEESLGEAMREDDPKASDITAARIVLLKAKIASNAAHRKANLPVLYAEVQ